MAKRHHKKKTIRKANSVAKELFSGLVHKPKTEAKRKGKGSYNRKKIKNFNEELPKSSSFFLCAA